MSNNKNPKTDGFFEDESLRSNGKGMRQTEHRANRHREKEILREYLDYNPEEFDEISDEQQDDPYDPERY